MLKKHRETIAYIICGALTVAVNTALYLGFALIVHDMIANTIAFFLAVLFAYFTNCMLVFKQRPSWLTLVRFFGMRIGTILIDDGGMWLLLSLGCAGLVAKCIVNAVIIVINYLVSKFYIFKNNGQRSE
ncbi:MAG: GtrA family protein [Clostridiales Family XIII bacterium]|nr:GtrA family protein [Clostridiales Family XIII bacterium]